MNPHDPKSKTSSSLNASPNSAGGLQIDDGADLTRRDDTAAARIPVAPRNRGGTVLARTLTPAWKKVWAAVPKSDRGYLGPLFRACSYDGLPPEALTDDYVQAWADGRPNSGRSGWYNTTIDKLNTLHEPFSYLPLLQRRLTIHDARAIARSRLDPWMLREIDEYGEALALQKQEVKRSTTTIDVIRRRLTSGLQRLTDLGLARGSFAAAFASDADVRVFFASFEARDRIVGDLADLFLHRSLYVEHDRLTRPTERVPKKTNDLSGAIMRDIVGRDGGDVICECMTRIMNTPTAPGCRTLERARADLGVLIIAATFCRREDLHAARFDGAPRAMADGTRRGLSIAAGKDRVDVESAFMSPYIDTVHALYEQVRGKAPLHLFETAEGQVVNPTTISNAVRRHSGALTPTALIALNLAELIRDTSLQDWELAAYVNYSTASNFTQRFRQLRQHTAAAGFDKRAGAGVPENAPDHPRAA